jgi:hypothetical protein
MRHGTRFFKFSLWLATTSLTFGTTAPAWAQPAPPDAAAPATDDNAADPPSVAGRLAEITGTVSTHAAGQDQWSPAVVNTPATTGDAFWTEPQASASLEIGGDRIAMSEATELDINQLDQGQFTTTAPQGEVYLNLPDMADGQALTVNTPRGAVQITAAGQYDIAAGDSANPTVVTVVAGSAHITSPGLDLTVGPQQTASITGSDQFTGTAGPIQTDDFLQAQASRDQPAPPQQAAPPQVSNMTGGSDLARYGTWQTAPDYGAVWYPNNVPSGWAPYRAGHWSYVAPWGWTWIDDAPWGFAPFHYGRWVSYGGRWGWVAAAQDAPPSAYPVYAPALVSFVDVGGSLLTGAAIGFAAGALAGGGGVGWVPLGFREPFYPWYRTSPRYLQNVNRISVVNVTNITINNYRTVNINNFRNVRAATVVPAGAMIRGQRLAGFARPLPPAVLAQARPVFGRVPVAPSALTPGLTRDAARRYNVALPPRPVRPVAPGPVVRPVMPARPGTLPARPPLRPAPGGGPGGIARPGQPGRPAPGPRPGAPGPQIGGPRPGLPALRPPGQVPGRPPAAGRPGPRPGAGAPVTPPAPRPMPPPTSPKPVPVRPAAPTRPAAPSRPAMPARPGTPARPPVAPPQRPAPAPAPRPGNVAPRPAPRPAEPRPAPAPAPRPAPEARPAPAPRPAPAARPAPAPRPARPAPPPKKPTPNQPN